MKELSPQAEAKDMEPAERKGPPQKRRAAFVGRGAAAE